MCNEFDNSIIEKLNEIEKLLDKTTPLLPPDNIIQMNIELTLKTTIHPLVILNLVDKVSR